MVPIIAPGDVDNVSWDTQCDYVFVFKGPKDTAYMYCGDRWKRPRPTRLGDYVWTPITFTPHDSVVVNYYQDWEVDPDQGIWRPIDSTRNLALHKTATASSTSGSNAPNNVTDYSTWENYTNTKWTSEASDPQWIMIDLGSPMPVNRVIRYKKDCDNADQAVKLDFRGWADDCFNAKKQLAQNNYSLRPKGGLMNYRGILVIVLIVSQSTGIFAQTKSMLIAGVSRNYIVHAPSGLTSPPLVFNIHGYNMDAASEQSYTKMDQVADREKFIVVYPNAINKSWDLTGANDYAFILAIIDTMDAKYPIDRNRIYSSGFSQGGFMSFQLACRYSDIFAAIAPTSGLVSGTCNLKRPVPMRLTFGTNEGFEGGTASFMQSVAT